MHPREELARRRMLLVVIMITAGSRHRSATRAYTHWAMATLRLLGMPLSMVSSWEMQRRILTLCASGHVLSFWERVNA